MADAGKINASERRKLRVSFAGLLERNIQNPCQKFAASYLPKAMLAWANGHVSSSQMLEIYFN
jgi:hypothetical protein